MPYIYKNNDLLISPQAKVTMQSTGSLIGDSDKNDLKTLTNEHKRVYNEISEDSDQVMSRNSTPTKRPKLSVGFEMQDPKDSDLGKDQLGALSDTALYSSERSYHNAASGPVNFVNKSRAAPSINWNVGTKARIRISLGGGSKKADSQEDGEPKKLERRKSQSPAQSAIQARGS